jgi:hypothetical protein
MQWIFADIAELQQTKGDNKVIVMNQLRLGFLLGGIGAITIACQPSSNPPDAKLPSPEGTAAGAIANSVENNFDEELYLFANPDVKDLIKQGKYQSGQDHYTQIGQTAKKPSGEDYESFFTGSNGNETVRGFGKGKQAHFAGVAFEILPKKDDPLPLRPKNLGKGEVDVLVGTKEGGNEFVLGSFITSVNPKASPFYVGKGDADYARIQNFTQGNDSIILAGEPAQYQFEPVDGAIRISINGDLIAIVENTKQLKVGEVVKQYGVFTMR